MVRCKSGRCSIGLRAWVGLELKSIFTEAEKILPFVETIGQRENLSDELVDRVKLEGHTTSLISIGDFVAKLADKKETASSGFQ